MTTPVRAEFLAGVIEGFYGPPWTQAERIEMLDWMAQGALNTYLYAPKDDLKQRAIWRELYDDAEAEDLRQLIAECGRRSIRFVSALSPGLDIRFSSEADLESLKSRFAQLLALGCCHFALFFDDIPDRLDPEDALRWGTFASAQCAIANILFRWIRERCSEARFLFCPTPYCSRMVDSGLGGEGYLNTVGAELALEIDVFWTGPDIISREISVDHVKELQTILRRKPLIWDNLHANDYDGRRFFCGPYQGRPTELLGEVSGLMINPNTEFELNFVPLRTLSAFLKSPSTWDPRSAYLLAMRDWFPRFATVGKQVSLEDLILFGDCYYLPYQDGTAGHALYEFVRTSLALDPQEWGAETNQLRGLLARLREFCVRMTELRHRPLFNALSRRIWELREELDLLDRHLAFKMQGSNCGLPFTSDFHRPGTYRGGMVARLQRLLPMRGDGTFAAEANYLP